MVVVLVVGGVLGFVHISNEVNPSGPAGRTVTVTVPAGASTARIGDILAKAGVIHGPTVFEIYVKIEAAGPLLPGTYHLATNEAYSKVVAALERVVIVIEKLLVPEGYTIRQMAAALEGRGIGVSPGAFVTAATGGQVRSPYEPATTTTWRACFSRPPTRCARVSHRTTSCSTWSTRSTITPPSSTWRRGPRGFTTAPTRS